MQGDVMTITLTSSMIDPGREIGMMRALGARGWQVACIFWIEGAALGIVDWAIGSLLSIPVSRSVLNQFANLVHTWPSDGIQIPARRTGGPLPLSGHAEMVSTTGQNVIQRGSCDAKAQSSSERPTA